MSNPFTSILANFILLLVALAVMSSPQVFLAILG